MGRRTEEDGFAAPYRVKIQETPPSVGSLPWRFLLLGGEWICTTSPHQRRVPNSGFLAVHKVSLVLSLLPSFLGPSRSSYADRNVLSGPCFFEVTADSVVRSPSWLYSAFPVSFSACLMRPSASALVKASDSA